MKLSILIVPLVLQSAACTTRPQVFSPDDAGPGQDADATPRPGLRGEYFRDVDLVDFAGIFIDPQINFVDNKLYEIGRARVGVADRFSIRWTGEIFLRAGERTLTVAAEQGARLFVDGRLLIDAWATRNKVNSSLLSLDADGWHALRVEYFHDNVPADIQLLVSTPVGQEVVAAVDLRHR